MGALTAFREKAASLRKEREELDTAAEREEDEETYAGRRSPGRLRKGLRTPESAYYRPILRVLAEMGGSGRVIELLRKVKVPSPEVRADDYPFQFSGGMSQRCLAFPAGPTCSSPTSRPRPWT